MKYKTRLSIVATIAVILAVIPVISAAAPVLPDSSVTYTITIKDDGTADWHVEYRTPLATEEDAGKFDSYAKNLSLTYLPQFQDLMQHSAAQAAEATSRPMEITDFAGDAIIQTTPTGKYGLVSYSFGWKNFAEKGSDLAIGDAFAGGMYLAKDTTLVIRYPEGYTVRSAEPAPDLTRDGLIWYGQRSFGSGEPRLVVEKPGFPWLPVIVGGILVLLVIAGSSWIIYQRRSPESVEPVELVEPEASPVTLSETELFSLEEKIIQLLKTSGGEQYQSEIVRNLGLPKSTVSATLNDLNKRGIVQKIKKGRENLIRLV
jgi:uncharacterized membrane protein